MGHPHVQRRHAAIHKFLIILSPHLPRKYPEFLTSCPCTRRRNTHKLLTKPSPCLPRKYPEFLTSPSLHSSQNIPQVSDIPPQHLPLTPPSIYPYMENFAFSFSRFGQSRLR